MSRELPQSDLKIGVALDAWEGDPEGENHVMDKVVQQLLAILRSAGKHLKNRKKYS